MMDQSEPILSHLAAQFFSRNYDYLWLRAMLEQAGKTKTDGSTLITGSSHALNGIKENCWKRAFPGRLWSASPPCCPRAR